MDNSESNISFSDEFLLQCVSNYRPLYDKSDKGYKSLLQKENCWVSVANSLHCTVADAKARFKSLREKYRREVKISEQLGRSGAPSSARPVWPLMTFFKFMYKCGEESERQTTSNFPYESQVSDAEEENIFELEENAFACTSTVDDVPTPKRKRGTSANSAKTTEISQIDNVLVDVSNALGRMQQNKTEITNRYDIFGKCMASELKEIGEPHASELMEDLQITMINFKRELRTSK